jgi:hypothetical protein
MGNPKFERFRKLDRYPPGYTRDSISPKELLDHFESLGLNYYGYQPKTSLEDGVHHVGCAIHKHFQNVGYWK